MKSRDGMDTEIKGFYKHSKLSVLGIYSLREAGLANR